MYRHFWCVAAVTTLAAVPGWPALQAQTAPAPLLVSSPTIKSMEVIPADHTADGKNTSPALAWSGAPAATREFALIMDDPDAPTPQPFVHWVIYKIPATARGLPEAIPAGPVSAAGVAGAVQGPTGFDAFRRANTPPAAPGYRGPAPPPGKPHHYTFTVYALDAPLDVQEGLDKAGLLKAMEGHVIGRGQLVGLYERKAPATPGH
jgi:hypothetical protein